MSVIPPSMPLQPSSRRVDMETVREVSLAVNAAHRFVYFVPEGAEQAAAFGVTGHGPMYFAFRAAAMGAVPWQVALATFYNFSPRSAQAMTGVWQAAPPERWQAARFVAVGRATERVGVPLTAEEIAEARSLTDRVVAGADYAGKTLAAANASVPLPSDPLVALWQQITVLREWRGDAHLVVLADHGLGPCDCNVLQTSTGHLPTGLMRATRQWNDEEWAAATARLVARGWLDADGSVRDAGHAAREQIEHDTDRHCAALWAAVGDDGARRLASLIEPINQAFTAAGTYKRR